MTSNLVVHDRIAKQMALQNARLSHALIIAGSTGMGKGALARQLIATQLGLEPAALATSPDFSCIQPDDKATISIEAIRSVRRFLKLKTPGKAKQIRRAILIEHAHCLTAEAQNAFLKLFEEPPADTIIVLTVDNLQSLLSTIRSRGQVLSMLPPTKEQLLAYFNDSYPTAAVSQAYFMSGGLPGLMHAILAEDHDHPLTKSVVLAKGLLQQDLFTRLAQVDLLGKQRPEALMLCEALLRIARIALDQAAIKQDVRRLTQWHRIIMAAYRARRQLAASGNTKLTLTQLMLHLSA